jgi:hypothetical protein
MHELCRSAVISKCIKLYPLSLSMRTKDEDLPWTLALKRLIPANIYELRKSLSILLSSYPAAFFHPPLNPVINSLSMMRRPRCCRMILNLLPSCLSSASHLQAYHDLNWQPRSSLLQLCLKIRMMRTEANASLHNSVNQASYSCKVDLESGYLESGILLMHMQRRDSMQ